MNESGIRNHDVDTVLQKAQEHGYHKSGDRVWVDCNLIPSGLTTADIIHALYKHVASANNYPEKSWDEIKNHLNEAKTSCLYMPSIPFGDANPYHVKDIGQVRFDCDIYPKRIVITLFERNYGSMEELVKNLWIKRADDCVKMNTPTTRQVPI